MSVWEREKQQRQRRSKMPSFSSSLLEAIYHSIDEESPAGDHDRRRNGGAQVEEEIESFRRAIMVEKWMESQSTMSRSRHVPSNSGSSTDSSMLSSSETESSASKSTPRPWISVKHYLSGGTTPPTKLGEGTFKRTKSRAMKIYGDLKKANKEPISPRGKIASFLNSIFTPRNLKKERQHFEEDWNSVRKSRSMKESSSTAATCLFASRPCLSRNPSSKTSNRSKRVVRFCPVSVVLDEGSSDKSKPRHGEYFTDVSSCVPPIVGSRFIKENIDSFRAYEAGKSMRRHELKDLYDDNVDIADVDDKSCASSDLFELESIGRIGFGVYDGEELPVYETTSLQKMNKGAAF